MSDRSGDLLDFKSGVGTVRGALVPTRVNNKSNFKPAYFPAGFDVSCSICAFWRRKASVPSPATTISAFAVGLVVAMPTLPRSRLGNPALSSEPPAHSGSSEQQKLCVKKAGASESAHET